jgi:hypothetical protein
MKAFLRCWRLFVLVAAILIAPQASLLHALAHDLDGRSSNESSEKRNHTAAKVCGTCLAGAQVGGSLPSRFGWLLEAHEPVVPVAVATISWPTRHVAVFQARAPPLATI